MRFAEAEFDRYVEQVRVDWNNVGVAVAVVLGNDVFYARGFGARQAGRAEGVNPDTLFQVGSTTKAFTAVALGVLVEERKVHWDDPVIRYLPDLQLQDPWLARNLTIRDALTHRSGILGPYYFALGIMDADTAVHQLRYAMQEAQFRNSYRYSNLMYAVAGKVIEAASGLTWREFIRRRLLQPLDMHRSRPSPFEVWDARYVTPTFFGSAPGGHPTLADARDSNVAMPHGWDENGQLALLPWRSYDNAAGAGAMVSSAADMANWLILHLNDGHFAGRRLLRTETLRELHATQNPHGDANRSPFDHAVESYAMGWRRAEQCGHVRLAHGGGVIGFPSYVAMLPDIRLGVVVLSNGPMYIHDNSLEYVLHKAIVFRVFDLVLGRPARNWSREFLELSLKLRKTEEKQQMLRRQRLPNARASLPLEQYEGDYEDVKDHSVRVSVRLEHDQLTLSFAGAGAFSARLEHWHHDLFRLRVGPGVADVLEPMFAAFAVSPAGRVVSMSVFDATFRRVAAPGDGRESSQQDDGQ